MGKDRSTNYFTDSPFLQTCYLRDPPSSAFAETRISIFICQLIYSQAVNNFLQQANAFLHSRACLHQPFPCTAKSPRNSRAFIVCGFEWWRRGESNPCPKASPHGFLRAQSVICISQFRRPPTGSGSAIPEKFPYQPSGSQALRYLALRRPDPLPREGRGLNVSRLSC